MPQKVVTLIGTISVVMLFSVCLLTSFYMSSQLTDAAESNNYPNVSLDNIAAIERFISSADEVNDSVYGDISFSATVSRQIQDVSSTSNTVAKVRYWARDNQYFRFDQRIIESNDPRYPLGYGERFVIGHDFYCKLIARSNKDPFILDQWGSAHEGMRFFGGRDPIIRASVCLQGPIRITNILKNLIGSQTIDNGSTSHWLLNKISEPENSSTIIVKYTWKDIPYETQGEMLCNKEYGVVLEYKDRTIGNGEKGELVITSESKKEYDFARFGHLPITLVENVVQSDGSYVSYKGKLDNVDKSEIPLGVFSLEAQGLTSLQPQSVWSRRIWILLAGALLLGVVYLIKRAKYRAI